MRIVRIGMRNEFLLVSVLAVALPAVIVIVPWNGATLVLSLLFLLFLPGYALLAALFPGMEEIDIARRMALSVGVSVAAVTLVGMIINFAGWGIGQGPVISSVAGLVLCASAIAWKRRRGLPVEERSGVRFRLPFSFGALRDAWLLTDSRNKALSSLLAVAVVGALIAVGFTVAAPRAGDPFSGFYLPGPVGEPGGQSRDARVGEAVEVTVGIRNHEQASVEYRIETWLDGVLNSELSPGWIADGEDWQGVLSFTPTTAGEHVKVEFRLFRNGEADPRLEPLYLWFNVAE